jgi:hypothetical protein
VRYSSIRGTVKAKKISFSWKLFWRCGILEVDHVGQYQQNRGTGAHKINGRMPDSADYGSGPSENQKSFINIADSKG